MPHNSPGPVRRPRVVIGAVLSLALACGSSAPAVIKTTSVPKPPGWLTKPPQAPDALYFSGMKEGAESLDDGKDAATDRARDEASKFIGVEVSSLHTDVQSSDLGAESQSVNDTVKSRAQALIRSAEVADVYWEKNSRSAGATTIDRYDVSVLIKLPRAEVEAERKRQADEAKSTAVSMLARFRDGQAQEQQGASVAALVRYRDVVKQLAAVGRDVQTGDAQIGTAGQLRSLAQDAAARVQQKARRAVVLGPDMAIGPLTAGLSKKGFSAQAERASETDALAGARNGGLPYVIEIKMNVAPGGQVFQQVAANVSLDVRALDSQSGAVVASVQKMGKGFGHNQDEAARKGAEDAGVGAGAELANALIAKESGL